jgi:hypothetical protein
VVPGGGSNLHCKKTKDKTKEKKPKKRTVARSIIQVKDIMNQHAGRSLNNPKHLLLRGVSNLIRVGKNIMIIKGHILTDFVLYIYNRTLESSSISAK